ncbi:MAG: alcohol dehydrogenase catalytic domain-containing protein [Clostridia bacterium]|nr:alcohol dehydrogenase catalytic domain-containing protein [Clostridia bacterium]
MNTSKAAIFTGINKPFEIREYPITKPEAGIAAMSLVASGVCGTDLHIHSGRLASPPNHIIGHEFIGRIEDLGEGIENLRVGDYVISDIACPCGECLLCKTGDDANCVHMSVTNGGDPHDAPHFHGGYGKMCYAPATNLIKIPEGVNPRTAAVFACAGPTCMHAFKLGHEAGWREADTNVAVVQGSGAIGSFAAMYLKASGIPHVITVTAGHPSDEMIATLKCLGADEIYSLDVEGEDAITARITELTGGLGADLVFEASGGAGAVPFGMKILRNRGVYLIPGQYSDRGPIPIEPHRITFGALRLIGSSQYSFSDVDTYADFLLAHPELHAAIDKTATDYPLEKINEAYADLRAGKVTKVLLV